jgi:SEC-C motif-containing protein
MTDQKWLGLKIMAIEAGQVGDDQGNVEFVARYKIAGRAHRLHEISQFEKLGGRWVYLHGERLA